MSCVRGQGGQAAGYKLLTCIFDACSEFSQNMRRMPAKGEYQTWDYNQSQINNHLGIVFHTM